MGEKCECSPKNLHTNVFSSFLHNCQNWETANMSLSRSMYKWIVVHPDNGILISAKKNELSSHENAWGKQMHITKWKESIWKGCILCDSNYMTLWKRQNLGDKKINGCQELVGEGEGWIGRARGFLGQWKMLCMTPQRQILVRAHRMYTTKSLLM